MRALLALSRRIDAFTQACGWVAAVAVLAACLISCGNALVRFTFGRTSIAWSDIQWQLFAACVMLGAAHVLRSNEHVRVDLIYGRISQRAQVWVDLLGLVLFVLPVMALMLHFAWPYFVGKLTSGLFPLDTIGNLGLLPYLGKLLSTGETSGAGGLMYWPAALMLPLGFALVLLQAVSEIIKRVGWLLGRNALDIHYERPLQ
jgi:TRAP-type mannitol/chloroaromatic compound transport system permease small subunit